MSPVSRRRGFEGDLEALSVVELVQTLSLGGRTACVTFRSGSAQGTIWLVDGAMKHATCGSLFGELAVYALVEWPTGRFIVEDDIESPCRSITGDTTQLVLESLRRIDEKDGSAAGEETRQLPVAIPAHKSRTSERRQLFTVCALSMVIGAAVAATAYRAWLSRESEGVPTLIAMHAADGSPTAAGEKPPVKKALQPAKRIK